MFAVIEVFESPDLTTSDFFVRSDEERILQKEGG
jgi:hypothetical protein